MPHSRSSTPAASCGGAARRRVASALVALAASGTLSAPAHADVPSDAYPTPQAVAANAEFLAHVPAPPGGARAVCVIDTGVTPLQDTASQITERISILPGTVDDVHHRDDDPLSGHGTFVAAAIASQIDGWGSAGFWPAAKIVSVRVFPAAGEGGARDADYLLALNECAQPQRRVTVVVLAIAGPSTPDGLTRLESRVISLRSRGISVVAAVGNDGGNVRYPARFPSVLGVGASDLTNGLCSFSNRGEGVAILVSGCETQISSFDGGTASFSGTSYAAPLVAAVLLALRSHRPDINAENAERTIIATGRVTPSGRTMDAAAAFRASGLESAIAPAGERTPGLTGGGSVATTPPTKLADKQQPPQRPRLRRLRFHRHRLHVVLARPRGPIESAWFKVDSRVHRRRNPELTIHARKWRRITVRFVSPSGLTSRALLIQRD